MLDDNNQSNNNQPLDSNLNNDSFVNQLGNNMNNASTPQVGGNAPNKGSKMKILIISIVAAATVVIGGVSAAVLMKNNDEKNNQNEYKEPAKNQENQNVNNDNEDKQDDEAGDYYFWKDTLKAGDKKELKFLFNDQFKAPLTIDNIKQYGKFRLSGMSFVNGVLTHNHDRLDFDTILKQDSHNNSNGYQYWEIATVYDSEVDDNLKFEFYNANDIQGYSIQQAWDDNYWHLSTISPYSIYEALGLPNDLKIWNEDTKKYDALDKIIENFGSPSYLLVSDGFDTMKIDSKNFSSLSYALVYEYDNYVVTIYIHEMIYARYNSVSSKLGEVTYYPKDGWNKYFKDEYMKSAGKPIVKFLK